jgi:hypothetical protein
MGNVPAGPFSNQRMVPLGHKGPVPPKRRSLGLRDLRRQLELIDQRDRAGSRTMIRWIAAGIGGSGS